MPDSRYPSKHLSHQVEDDEHWAQPGLEQLCTDKRWIDRMKSKMNGLLIWWFNGGFIIIWKHNNLDKGILFIIIFYVR
jgi:hypothetical protein